MRYDVAKKILAKRLKIISFKMIFILFAICFIMLSILFWKNQEAKALEQLYNRTLGKAQYYTSEIELRFNRIYTAIDILSKKGVFPETRNATEWNSDAQYYIDYSRGIDKILMVDTSLQIRKIIPDSASNLLMNKQIDEIDSDSSSEVLIWKSIYDGAELKGFLVGIIKISDFISPLTGSSEDEYMIKLENDELAIFTPDNWGKNKPDYSIINIITLQNTDVWKITVAPENGLYNSIIQGQMQILYFSLSFSLFALISMFFAQKSIYKSKQLEQKENQLLISNSQLKAVNKELESFTYSISHDLRAPLRHMVGFIELLNKRLPELLDDQNKHYLKVITDAATTMGQLIDDLLSFSRMGRTELIHRKVDLNDLIKNVIIRFAAETKNREIKWDIAKLPCVYGDSDMIYLAFTNLISNALKFTQMKPVAEIKICAETDNSSSLSSEVVISIKDNGAGFDMQYKDKLFNVFQRLHSQKEFSGTGIGLANVKLIIQRHGGRVWAESEVNQGASFYVSLFKFEEE